MTGAFAWTLPVGARERAKDRIKENNIRMVITLDFMIDSLS